MAESSPVLWAQGLACGYRGRTVLTDLDFTIHSGEIVGLLGCNGAGKSTLLKTLARALLPLSGEVRLEGRSLAGLTSREVATAIGYVPQQEQPAFDFSALQVVLMGRYAHSHGLFETQNDLDVATIAMRQVDCEHLTNRSVSSLSGGEAQRVLIARALAQEPRLLLLDEPTSHLDPAHQVGVSRLLSELAKKHLAIITAVHDINWAAQTCTRFLILHDGQLLWAGELSEAHKKGILSQAYGVDFEIAMANHLERYFAR